MKRGIGILSGTVIVVVGIFVLAGKVTWWNAWLFLIFMLFVGVFNQRIINSTPGLAKERKTAAAKSKPWDVMLVRILTIISPSMLLVAALDTRFRWLPCVPVSISVAAFLTMIPTAILIYRTIAANRFFSSHVRIQKDRGHVLISTGPYRIIRHPGYTGTMFFYLLAPMALGSWTAFILGVCATVILIYRTIKEEKLLMEKLPGYITYKSQVRNRLIPGIW